MSFWKSLFSGIGKSIAKEIVSAAIADAITAAHQEIEKHKGTSEAEKQFMKHGVALAVERIDAFVAKRLS